jgi:hypothetical protein
MICAVCTSVLQNVPPQAKQSGDDIPHQLTISSLTIALADQCYICNRFWARLTTEQRLTIASVASVKSAEESCIAADIDNKESEGYITVCDVENGTDYGFPGCYLLHVIYRARQKSMPRVRLILQPLSRTYLSF